MEFDWKVEGETRKDVWLNGIKENDQRKEKIGNTDWKECIRNRNRQKECRWQLRLG